MRGLTLNPISRGAILLSILAVIVQVVSPRVASAVPTTGPGENMVVSMDVERNETYIDTIVSNDPNNTETLTIIAFVGDTVDVNAGATDNDVYLNGTSFASTHGRTAVWLDDAATEGWDGFGEQSVEFEEADGGTTKEFTLRVDDDATDTCMDQSITIQLKVLVLEVEIADVVRRSDLPDSLPPRKTKDVSVTITPSLSGTGHDVEFDVINGSADNGTATISANATRTTSGTITVLGGNQTEPGHAGELNIRARLDGTEQCDTSDGFSVCAHPCNFTISRDSDLDEVIGGVAYVGVKAKNEWESDSGVHADLDEAERRERLDEYYRTNPPFTVGGAGNPGGYFAATLAFTIDTHGYARVAINPTTFGHNILEQLFQFKCDRCGASDAVCDNSGFHIDHYVWWRIPWGWTHNCTKSGSAVTIGTQSTAAGGGTATSDNHSLE